MHSFNNDYSTSTKDLQATPPLHNERKGERMVYSWYTKRQIIYYYKQGYQTPSIASLLLDEDIVASRVGISKLLRRYKETGIIM